MSARVINRKATCSSRGCAVSTGAVVVSEAISTDMSGSPSEEPGRLHQKHDRHDDENDGVRSFRVEHFRQTFDQTEQEPGDDRAKDGAHAADDHDGKYDDNE